MSKTGETMHLESDPDCPFCPQNVRPRIIKELGSVFAVKDAYPVSRDHLQQSAEMSMQPVDGGARIGRWDLRRCEVAVLNRPVQVSSAGAECESVFLREDPYSQGLSRCPRSKSGIASMGSTARPDRNSERVTEG